MCLPEIGFQLIYHLTHLACGARPREEGHLSKLLEPVSATMHIPTRLQGQQHTSSSTMPHVESRSSILPTRAVMQAVTRAAPGLLPLSLYMLVCDKTDLEPLC